MAIEGGTRELIAQLVKRGLVRDVAELYRLKPAEIAALDGMDEQAAKRFFTAIVASKKREAWRVLYGLGIPHIGAEATQSLCRSFPSLDDIFAAGGKRLMEAEGVSEIMAQSILRWQSDSVNRKLLGRLRKADVNFKSGSLDAAVSAKPAN